MYTISKEATKIFCLLLGKLGNRQNINITGHRFPPLYFEKLTGEVCWQGKKLTCYLLAHIYKGQQKKQVKNPCMSFLVLDRRLEIDDTAIFVYPQSLVKGGMTEPNGEEAAHVEYGQIIHFNPKRQQDQARYAFTWLRTLRRQKYFA